MRLDILLFAIPLIIGCDSQNNDTQHINSVLMNQALEDVNQSTEIIDNRIGHLYDLFEKRIHDELYFISKYDTLLITLDSLMFNYGDLEKTLDTISVEILKETSDMNKVSMGVEKVNNILVELENTFADYIMGNGRFYNLNEDKIGERIKHFTGLSDELKNTLKYNMGELSTQNEKSLFKAILENEVVRTKYEMTTTLMELLKLPCMSFKEYFPVVLNGGSGQIPFGEEVSLDIGIGEYYTYPSEESGFEILVNGEKQMLKKGRVKYELDTKKIGEKKLDILIKYRNDKTGVYREFDWEYSYSISE